MKRLIIYIILIFCTITVLSNEQTQLDSAKNLYIENQYYEAQLIYENLIAEGFVSSELFYNLGNCYFKTDQLASSIYYYEQALKLAPGNSNIKHNLKIANSKITNRVESVPEIFYMKWFHTIRNWFSSNTWALISIITFTITLIFIGLKLFSKKRIIKYSSLYLAVFSAVLFVSSFTFSVSQKKYQLSKNQAIVFDASMVKSSPSTDGNNLFEVHEGLKVQVIDTLNHWTEIRLSDGKQGWINSEQIKRF
jgi:tetratricopeptide (TPR) repeat protein